MSGDKIPFGERIRLIKENRRKIKRSGEYIDGLFCGFASLLVSENEVDPMM